MRTEIRLAALGGQGMILAGVILGKAAIADGKNAVQSQSYGPESRGGAARSEVIIADEEIDYPMVIKADVLVALSQPGYDKYITEIKPAGTVIIDKDLVEVDNPPESEAYYKLPLVHTADRLGNRIVANIITLGSLCAITGVVSKDSLTKAVQSSFPEKILDLNLEAFAAGYDLGRQALENKDKGEK
ncbi:MAG: 2-oxoacid:ferredoxin oxidoreductase subunit gamma [FCB group bacterium]|nr:2-oxoacid:ferredoxin oxidoreductase subunit gamma [FCB group bacterium]